VSDFKHTVNILRPFYRGLPLIILSMILCITAARIYLKYATPIYESVAQIKLADAQIGVPHQNLYRDFDVFASNSKIGAEVEMLKSQVVLKRALRGLDLGITVFRKGELHKTELYKDCPFKIIAQPLIKTVYDSTFKLIISGDSLVEIINPSRMSVHGRLNHLIAVPGLNIIIQINDSMIASKPDMLINDRYEFIINSENNLILKTREILDVMAADKEVPVLRIAYKCPVPQKSADLVNHISEAYINDYIEEKFAAADTTVTFLNREVADYSDKLITSENSMEVFRKQNNIVNIKQETETDLRKLAELKNQLAALQMEMASMDTLEQYITNGRSHFYDLAPNFQSFNDLLSTEIMKKIKGLQSDRRDLLLKYTPENEKVTVIDSKLEDLYSYLQESITNTKKSIDIKYRNLNETILLSEKEFESYPFKDKSMTILERNFNLNDQIYRFLREKRTDAEIARAANISFHRIISRAEVADKPVSPNPVLLKVLGGFFGFLGGTFAIYLIHFLKDRVNNELNVQKNSDIPVFALIPFLKKGIKTEVIFGKMAVDLQVQQNLEKNSLIVISSFGSGEGKRTIALGLTRAASDMGKNVLMLDTKDDSAWVAYRDNDVRSVVEFCADWRKPEILKSFLKSLQKQYDVIIVKNMAVEVDACALLWMSHASINLFVLDSRITKARKVMEMNLMKEELKLKNIEFIINRNGYTPSVYSSIVKYFKSGEPKKLV
jgi:uncharacterized protein involved in exopolysaccharide biosynthesis